MPHCPRVSPEKVRESAEECDAAGGNAGAGGLEAEAPVLSALRAKAQKQWFREETSKHELLSENEFDVAVGSGSKPTRCEKSHAFLSKRKKLMLKMIPYGRSCSTLIVVVNTIILGKTIIDIGVEPTGCIGETFVSRGFAACKNPRLQESNSSSTRRNLHKGNQSRENNFT